MIKEQSFHRLAVLTALVLSVTVQNIYPDTGKASAKVDRLVFAKLDEQGIPPSDTCSDEVFLRRAYLDIIGTLPKAQEARKFLDSFYYYVD